ncbi:hypothetical protein G3O06_20540 [Burkholderia sp. Ac-20345]|uniref:phage protease n=1 Tax=Burkholderia sp. Ac-20345 TaxID=2703891 RepID=UPI00197C6C72|nr:phage protease [Burkholderia sp. Ac-20345]MBN3779928.1 hypothetical protein [Burkholderia sp. Ac-20345]
MSKRSHTPSIGYAACALDLASSLSGSAQVFPMGAFRAADGSDRPADCAAWQMTPEIGARLVAAANARSTDYCFDYEHQVQRSAVNGKPAPAAGWFKTLEMRADGLWATGIRWTPAARQMIEAEEYRYTSPLFSYDKDTGAVLSILNVALTNTPALDGMDAIAASALAALTAQPTGNATEKSMDELLERLRYLLNLPLTATAQEIGAELDKVKVMLNEGNTNTAAASVSLIGTLTSLRTDLTTSRTALAAASAQAGAHDPSKFVPMDQFVLVQNQVAALSQQIETDERTELVEAGLSDGRILAVAKDYWMSQPIAALKSFLAVAQPIAALTATQTKGIPPKNAGVAALSTDEAKIAASLGVDPEKFATGLRAAN